MNSKLGDLVSREFANAVLLVSPVEEDHLALRNILNDSGWELREAHGISQAMGMLAKQSFPVVICEKELPVGDWKALFEALQLLPQPPRLIVSSLLADSRLWAEVLNLGGYDVLPKPFNSNEVLRTVRLASSNYLCKFENLALCRVA